MVFLRRAGTEMGAECYQTQMLEPLRGTVNPLLLIDSKISTPCEEDGFLRPLRAPYLTGKPMARRKTC